MIRFIKKIIRQLFCDHWFSTHNMCYKCNKKRKAN